MARGHAHERHIQVCAAGFRSTLHYIKLPGSPSTVMPPMLSTTIPAVKRRADYQQPDFLINHVDLEFTLIETSTKVICVSQVTRNGQHARPLVLDGEDIKLSSVSINGLAVSDG